jgi:hypothetical protein
MVMLDYLLKSLMITGKRFEKRLYRIFGTTFVFHVWTFSNDFLANLAIS